MEIYEQYADALESLLDTERAKTAADQLRQVAGHEGWVNDVAVTPDGKYVMSGSGDTTVRVWSLGDSLTPD